MRKEQAQGVQKSMLKTERKAGNYCKGQVI